MIAKLQDLGRSPRPREIRRRCAEIRRGWDERTRQARVVFPPPAEGSTPTEQTCARDRFRELGLDAQVGRLLYARLLRFRREESCEGEAAAGNATNSSSA